MALLYLEIAVPTCNLLVMSPHNVAKTSMCVSIAPGVCVCVCVCNMSTAPGVCVLGWVKYREHISLVLYFV